MELGSHSWVDFLAVELFLNTCFLGHCPRVCSPQLLERAISGVHKLLRIGGDDELMLNVLRCQLTY